MEFGWSLGGSGSLIISGSVFKHSKIQQTNKNGMCSPGEAGRITEEGGTRRHPGSTQAAPGGRGGNN